MVLQEPWQQVIYVKYRSRNISTSFNHSISVAPCIFYRPFLKVNKENAPPDGWRPEDKPEANKQYALTGGPGDKCISSLVNLTSLSIS